MTNEMKINALYKQHNETSATLWRELEAMQAAIRVGAIDRHSQLCTAMMQRDKIETATSEWFKAFTLLCAYESRDND